MARRLSNGFRHTITIGLALLARPKRKLLVRMIAFSRALPQQFNQPLPLTMARLTPPAPHLPGEPTVSPNEIRQLADAVASWHWRSPLGICLRRSLLRYHFLREANLPVSVVFGARFKSDQEGGGIGGHAWLTLEGQPYYENPTDYTGFVEMYRYPQTVNGQPSIVNAQLKT